MYNKYNRESVYVIMDYQKIDIIKDFIYYDLHFNEAVMDMVVETYSDRIFDVTINLIRDKVSFTLRRLLHEHFTLLKDNGLELIIGFYIRDSRNTIKDCALIISHDMKFFYDADKCQLKIQGFVGTEDNFKKQCENLNQFLILNKINNVKKRIF